MEKLELKHQQMRSLVGRYFNMPKPQTQKELNQYFNISIEVLFHSIDELKDELKEANKEIEKLEMLIRDKSDWYNNY